MAIFGDRPSAKGCLRHNSNVQSISGVEIDYDKGSLPFDAAVIILQATGLRGLVYTSASYIKGEKEKWRILAPLSKGYPPEARAELVAVLNGVLGGVAAPESFVLSTAFYYGAVDHNPDHRVELVDGDFLDLRPDLRSGKIGKNGKSNGEIRYGGSHGVVAPGRDEAEIKALLAKSQRRGRWHNSMLAAVASMVGKGWSNADIYAACAPYCSAGYGDADIERLIIDGREKWGMADPDRDVVGMAAPVVAAAIAAAGAPVTVPGPNWRECYVNGRPRASLHNADLAIEASGIRCSYDSFHNAMWLGRSDAATPMEPLERFYGRVTDLRIGLLRKYLSDRFGLDFTEKHVRDAVSIACSENAFDPVLDMLAEAEAAWDGVARLDRMAVDYFNADDTELNRVCVRKVMLAAVARVRQPGCKFDTVLVMESPEGLNKSSAWAVLAGEGNFSDQSILGQGGREVQEQLAGIWIHESPELAGMGKAEVEAIKAFASRQVDRARPAYGHFLVEQPRHSIEVATTNDSEYLQSQTGNRRFWPIRVRAAIDLVKLRSARLQLWGEAAHYQAQGEELTLEPRLWGAARAEQEARRVKDPWEALLGDLAAVASTGPTAGFGYIGNGIVHRVGDELRVSTAVIFEHFLKIPSGQLHNGHSKRLANTMRKLGWVNGVFKIEGKLVKGYLRT
jgi:predicted P-loop ATPase